MKVVFLDIDGVLNSKNFIDAGGCTKKTKFPSYVSMFIDCHAVALLKEIVDKTGAKIVISSSWRVDPKRTPEWFVDLFNTLCGVTFDIIGKTPVLGDFRGDEIKAWLKSVDVDNFVILDDDADFHKTQMPHLVQTSFDEGLTEKEVAQAIEILGNR